MINNTIYRIMSNTGVKHNDILQSKNDSLTYQHIKLENDLDVLLISDINSKMSSASLSIGVGSYDNGDVDGIAHFLEHMLFMGSTKYPDESQYHNFINTHAGNSNAYTAGNHTCYYFTIESDYFKEGLDIFGQFFVSPLLKKSSIMKEMNAVDSEHQKNIAVDPWRLNQVLSVVSKNTTPYYKFHTGSLETLNIPDIGESVTNFYNKYYSSHLMKLVVVGPNTLDELKEMATSIFSNVPKKSAIPLRNYEAPFITPAFLQVVPIKTNDKLSIYWQIPSYKLLYGWKPLNFLSHIIGHEGPGTILNCLKENNLATQLFAGISSEEQNFTLFSVDVKLTDHGYKNQKTVYDIIYKYIDLLLQKINSDDIEYLYNENKYISKLAFDNIEIPSDKTDYINGLSSTWATTSIPVYELISHNYLYNEFNDKLKEILKEITQLFTPENSVVIVSSKNYKSKTDSIEKWYGVEYRKFNSIELSNEYVESNNMEANKLSTHLSLPRPNPFLCKEPKMIEPIRSFTDPMIIKQGSGYTLYWKFDQSYGTPNVKFSTLIKLKDVDTSPKSSLVSQLFISCIKQLLNPYAYEYAMASYSANISVNNKYLLLSVYGFPEKLKDVVKLLVKYLTLGSGNITKTVFNMVKNETKKNLVNELYTEPYKQVHSIFRKQFTNRVYDHHDYLKIIDDISYDDIANVNMFNNVDVKSFVHGNISKQDALDLFKETEILVHNYERHSFDNKKIINEQLLQNTKELIKNVENITEKNSAVAIYYNFGYERPGYIKDWQVNDLLKMILDMDINNAFYTDLRANQQLGYIVQSSSTKFADIELPYSSYYFLVQSTHKDPTYLQEKIKAFIQEHWKLVQNLEDDVFEGYKHACEAQLSNPYQTLEDDSDETFYLIFGTERVFNYKQELINTLKTLNKNDYIQFFKKYLINNSSICTIGIKGNIVPI
jgi:insulysin